MGAIKQILDQLRDWSLFELVQEYGIETAEFLYYQVFGYGTAEERQRKGYSTRLKFKDKKKHGQKKET